MPSNTIILIFIARSFFLIITALQYNTVHKRFFFLNKKMISKFIYIQSLPTWCWGVWRSIGVSKVKNLLYHWKILTLHPYLKHDYFLVWKHDYCVSLNKFLNQPHPKWNIYKRSDNNLVYLKPPHYSFTINSNNLTSPWA